MNGLQHSKVAEEILDKFEHPDGDYWHDTELNDRNELDLRVAAVHGQLATAGAIAALTRSFQRVFESDPIRARGAAQQRANEAAQLDALGLDAADGDE